MEQPTVRSGPERLRALVRHWRARFSWLGLMWVFLASGTILALVVLPGLPSVAEIRNLGAMAEATTVYDMRDQAAFTLFKERRIEVPLSDVAPVAIQAVLAIEDQRFYRHFGIDPWRIGGALLANLRERGRTQGGSTITQQLARKSFLADTKSIRRKLREILVALRIERAFSKDQILELYLNKVYFGNGLYGIEAAARGYFDKPAKALTLEEAALLAGLIQAPSAYAPDEHPDRAKARRSTVLDQMVEAGFIDRETAAAAGRTALSLTNGFPDDPQGRYFKNYVSRLLVDRFGWEAVSEDGLRVYTTFDPQIQQAAEEALSRGIDELERLIRRQASSRGARAASKDEGHDALQGALVAVDPTTGEVRALVGGRDFGSSQFDRATQARRQAGSAFKPFVYAAALEMGYSPATLLTGLDDPMLAAGEGMWLPQDGHSTAESMTVRTALRTSSNRAAVQVLRAVSVPRAVTYARDLGLEAPAVPALALGAGEVSLLALTSAYSVFANGGTFRPPIVIRRVEDRSGRVLFSETPASRQVMREDTAFLMAQMLTDVVDRGTGYRVRQAGFRQPAAGKTGTTNDYHDAWFVGFTPKVVSGVWIGFDEPKPIMSNGYAGDVAAPIWGRFMREITSGQSGTWLRRPDSVTAVEICRESGLLPTGGCRRAWAVGRDGTLSEQSLVGIEYFRRGTEPVDECDLHGGPRVIDAATANEPKGGFWRRVIGIFKKGGG